MAHLEIFDTTVQKTNIILKAIDERFSWNNRHLAYLALRAVLHTLRDRLTPEHVAGLGDQLPMLIRGMYYEGWHPANVPLRMSKCEFVSEIERHITALSFDVSIEEMAKGVLTVVQDFTDPNEVRKIKRTLPHDIQDMFGST